MSKLIVISVLISIIIVAVFLKMKKQKTVRIPGDLIDVDSIEKILSDELKTGAVQDAVIDSAATAIINELEQEATEALPESLSPSVPESVLSEGDSAELKALLEGESLVLGIRRVLGMPIGPSPTTITTLVENPKPEEEEKTELKPISPENTEKSESDLNSLKDTIIQAEKETLIKQAEFLDVQVESIENEIEERTVNSVKEKSELERVQMEELEEVKRTSSELDVKRVEIRQEKEKMDLENKIEKDVEELARKSDQLASISDTKKEEAKDDKNLKDKAEKVKHPRKSKKGSVKTSKTTLENGGVSFVLDVPSDINPEESDQIEIVISKETSEIIEKYNEIKAKIVLDKSMENVSDEEKKIIKSAGKEFKKINKAYVSKRTEKIRKRVSDGKKK